VCRTLKNDIQTSHVPVVLLTALEGEAHRLRGLEDGADDYLAKPFNEVELVSRIGNLLEIRALLRQRFSLELRPAEAPDSHLLSRDRTFLERLARQVDAGHAEPTFAVCQLASALAMSERQLQRKLKALTGLTPAEYLRAHRLRQALKRLHAGERPGEVAYAVGFGSQAYFSTCFKAQFGFTPGEARDRRANPIDMTVS
jgi:AraC-like DNA-binding protein